MRVSIHMGGQAAGKLFDRLARTDWLAAAAAQTEAALPEAEARRRLPLVNHEFRRFLGRRLARLGKAGRAGS